MKVLKNADLSGSKVLVKKTAKPDGRNSDFTTLWILWNGFCCQKPIDDSFRKCFQPCPLTGTDFWEKTWTSQEPDDWPCSRLCWEARHMTSYNRHRLALTFRRFLASFFFCWKSDGLQDGFSPTWMPVVWTSELPGWTLQPGRFSWGGDGVVCGLNIYYSNGKWRAHLVFDLPKFKVLGIKRSSLKLKLLLILLRE